MTGLEYYVTQVITLGCFGIIVLSDSRYVRLVASFVFFASAFYAGLLGGNHV